MAHDESKPLPAGLNLSPFCVDLQSKKHLFRSTPAMEDDDYLDASRHCWCARTMQVLGPDKEPATPEDCRSARACFRGLL